MKIGFMQVDLHFEGCQSLKEKRSILQSIKSHLRSRLNVSVAEIGDHDLWQSSRFGLVAIGNGSDSIEQIFRASLSEMENRPDAVVSDYQIEML
jgi:uncharacterized protein YlxP (DUF503 family)